MEWKWNEGEEFVIAGIVDEELVYCNVSKGQGTHYWNGKEIVPKFDERGLKIHEVDKRIKRTSI